jgi:hypothetical protein
VRPSCSPTPPPSACWRVASPLDVLLCPENRVAGEQDSVRAAQIPIDNEKETEGVEEKLGEGKILFWGGGGLYFYMSPPGDWRQVNAPWRVV